MENSAQQKVLSEEEKRQLRLKRFGVSTPGQINKVN